MPVYLGIDWSQSKHDVLLTNEAGACLAQFTIPHSGEGFLKLEAMRSHVGIPPEDCVVGLETAHNLLVDFLWDRGYHQVYVVPPNVVKSNRGRYRQSGAQSDASDAWVVADVLRTDRGRLQPWFPDSAVTRQIRAKISLVCYLTRTSVALGNRLRAVLWRYYPAAAQVFSSLSSPIALAFVRTYPSPDAAATLSWGEFESFAKRHRYPRSRSLAKAFARLKAPYPGAAVDTILVYQTEAPLLAGMLVEVMGAKKAVLGQVEELLRQHPDREIFSSLPGTGDYLAAALLAKFGDDRKRFPTAASVQALAGTCPVTKSSGKWKVVHFRSACDREFRHIAQQRARCSLKQSL